MVDRLPLADLKTIQARVRELGRRIDIASATIATRPMGDGSPYVEVSHAYHWIVEERGKELQHRETTDLDERLYWIFETISFSAACDFEVAHRRPGEDSRRLLFAHHRTLLGALEPGWADRKAAEHRAILTDHPYDDSLG